jgi:hypothetical protein
MWFPRYHRRICCGLDWILSLSKPAEEYSVAVEERPDSKAERQAFGTEL